MKCPPTKQRSNDCGNTSGRKASKIPTEASAPPREQRFFLNSYHPLGETRRGRELAIARKLRPFVDNSIRREPDFEHRFPSITGLCRCNKLVGRLQVGDQVAYLTTKSGGERKLVALLEVIRVFTNHAKAAHWYRGKGLTVPSNCVVAGNPPLPASHAIARRRNVTYENWAAAYEWRATNYPTFVMCRALVRPNLTNPPSVSENIFGRPFPGTRGSARITEQEFSKLRKLL